MDNDHISCLRESMNATTHDFLVEFTPKLDKLFPKQLSSGYLDSMNEHLQTFYNDVLTELGNKQEAMSNKIEELLKEARELKRKLNVDFEFDLDNTDNMPLMVYQDKLDSDLSEMREKYQQKMNSINDCIKTQRLLCAELNEDIREFELSVEPLASDSEIYEFENYLLDLKTEKARRLNEIECLQHEIHDLCDEMGMEFHGLFSETLLTPTKENIKYLQDERDRYQKEKKEIKFECEQLLQKLEILWDCLDAPNSVRSKFRGIAAEYKVSSITELNRELKMCKTAKQENLKHFIEKLRIKIVELWDKIYKSQEERDKFEFLRSDTYTEDLLLLHEMELEECTQFYNENKNIFELFISRNQWWEKKKALEAKQNEPNRYNNRGGQLLKEEKERKQTDIEIPKIEKKITTLAEEFRRQNNRDFMINGTCIIQLLQKDLDSYRDSKELLKSARKAVGTPRKVAMTPRTPLIGQVTLKRMASTTNLGITKRRHLDIPTQEVNRTTSVQKMNTASYMIRSHTKRNLLSQYNDENIAGFVKPNGKRRMVPPNKKQGTLTNISASKIVKKYRLSNRRHSSHKGIVSDESLVNYDAFENNIKISQVSNSSVVGQNIITKSAKNNNYCAKSPLKPSNQ